MKRILFMAAVAAATMCAEAKDWPGFTRGMGIGGWLTNYKRFNVLPEHHRLPITIGDLEHFDSYITEKDIANIKSMGFDHVRLGFDQIVLEESPGKYRERTFRKVDDFIGWCEKHGLNMVLNLHKAVGNYCDIQEKVELLDDKGLQDRFVALWLEFERRYHDKPGLAFELLNEVRNVDPEKWNRLADRTLKAIREKNPNRWVVIGSTCWNSPGTLDKLKIWDDDKVVYTFHMYAPFEFTHQRGVLQAGPLYYNRTLEYPTKDVERYRGYHSLHGNAGGGYGPEVKEINKQILRNNMHGAHMFTKNHPDKILWNGEFGTIRHAPPASRVAYMHDVVVTCKEWGIPWCVWNYLSTPNDGNRFSLVDDDTRKILSPELLKACLGE
ncbi:MAG: cellulase family glycosylhydrolase [Kiritimatiellae bacterium]|nr:cellulase family glycosylhydrolase [Kiritimatiellia bacterium]